MAGHLMRVTLGLAVLLLCVSILCGCIDPQQQSGGTGSSETESTEGSPTESEGHTSAAGDSNATEAPSEAVTDRQGYYNEAEDGVSKRY